MNEEFEKMRAEFIAWMTGTYPDVYAKEAAEVYCEHNHISWLAWQASRKQAVGECAAVCDKINDDEWHAFKKAPLDDQRRGGDYTQGKSDGAADCADAIRALQKE
ncbi:hypothetical protein K6V90_09600 [Cupriavidus pauculus]|uniref:hypothetical protein n=1 Tax=Cupriavidus pauculus TaxID=82633 RepID=UPI001C93298D|nr:hypothetical protein [Cupriavidus pauculus]MBY4730786.1 hypothetical protein [Cupriavidus pauculus]